MKQNKGLMTEGVIWKQLLLFALPALLVLPRLKKAVLSRRYENIK